MGPLPSLLLLATLVGLAWIGVRSGIDRHH
jgi:hypothetical protein